MAKVATGPEIKALETNTYGAQVLIKRIRLNFVYLAKPKYQELSDSHKYQLTNLIPKGSDILAQLKPIVEKMVKMNEHAGLSEKQKAEALKIAFKIGGQKSLIKDGDKQIKEATGKPYEGNAGHYLLAASSLAEEVDGGFRPKKPIMFKDAAAKDFSESALAREFYSGIWANVFLNISCYKMKTGFGITCYISGVQKLKDDTKLGGVDPFEVEEDYADAFGEGESEDDDDSFGGI